MCRVLIAIHLKLTLLTKLTMAGNQSILGGNLEECSKDPVTGKQQMHPSSLAVSVE